MAHPSAVPGIAKPLTCSQFSAAFEQASRRPETNRLAGRGEQPRRPSGTFLAADRWDQPACPSPCQPPRPIMRTGHMRLTKVPWLRWTILLRRGSASCLTMPVRPGPAGHVARPMGNTHVTKGAAVIAESGAQSGQRAFRWWATVPTCTRRRPKATSTMPWARPPHGEVGCACCNRAASVVGHARVPSLRGPLGRAGGCRRPCVHVVWPPNPRPCRRSW